MNNGMLGPRSTSTVFYLPNDIGEEINSTHANLSIQEGAIVPSLSYPNVMYDTYLDTGNIYTNRGSSSALFVGRSSVSTSNQNLRSVSLLNMDFSGLPLPGTYEVIDASLELSAYNTYQSTQSNQPLDTTTSQRLPTQTLIQQYNPRKPLAELTHLKPKSI